MNQTEKYWICSHCQTNNPETNMICNKCCGLRPENAEFVTIQQEEETQLVDVANENEKNENKEESSYFRELLEKKKNGQELNKKEEDNYTYHYEQKPKEDMTPVDDKKNSKYYFGFFDTLEILTPIILLLFVMVIALVFTNLLSDNFSFSSENSLDTLGTPLLETRHEEIITEFSWERCVIVEEYKVVEEKIIYYYEIEQWVPERYIKTSDTNKLPYWAEPSLEGEQQCRPYYEQYWIHTVDENGNICSYSCDEETWNTYEIGDKIVYTTDFLGNVTDLIYFEKQ